MTSSGLPAAVRITRAAQENIRQHPDLAARFERSLATLAKRPNRGHLLTGDPLGGCRSLELTHAGGGFRAVYRWNQEQNTVIVFAVGQHHEVYALAAKRFPPPEPEQ